MKSLAKHICLWAWVLALIAQSIVIYNAPQSIVVAGVDVAQPTKMALIHTLIFVGFGLALAIAAYFAKKIGPSLTALSAALYLVHWFPIKSVVKFGLLVVAKGMFLIGSNPNVRWVAIIGDVILPVSFISVIVLLLIGPRRPTPTVPISGSQ
jgi:hypothetical protein